MNDQTPRAMRAASGGEDAADGRLTGCASMAAWPICARGSLPPLVTW
jgi:hypothetical protein